MYEYELLEAYSYHASVHCVTATQSVFLLFDAYTIVFVDDFDVELFVPIADKHICMAKKQMFLLPSHLACQCISVGSAKLNCLHIPNMTTFYIHYFNQSFYENEFNIDDLFYPLAMNSVMVQFKESLNIYLKNQIVNTSLTGVKALEFFHLLKFLYPGLEIVRFFVPLVNKEYEFLFFVLQNYTHVSTAQELCRLSPYSSVYFEKQFRKVFRLSPYQWMLERKKQALFYEIRETIKPLKNVADKYGFASIANLSDFCRKHFGFPPGCLRKNHRIIENLEY